MYISKAVDEWYNIYYQINRHLFVIILSDQVGRRLIVVYNHINTLKHHTNISQGKLWYTLLSSIVGHVVFNRGKCKFFLPLITVDKHDKILTT